MLNGTINKLTFISKNNGEPDAQCGIAGAGIDPDPAVESRPEIQDHAAAGVNYRGLRGIMDRILEMRIADQPFRIVRFFREKQTDSRTVEP